MDQPTLLVTGATGFVGSHVLMALQARGVRVIAACRSPERLPAGFTGEVRAGDLRDAAYLKDVLAGVDVVCHAAAWSSLWGHAEHSRALFLEPSLALLDAVVAQGISRFLFVSTTSANAPGAGIDARSAGRPRPFWPHLNNVIAIEDAMRVRAGATTMVNLRCGIFVGERYGLGLLPILLPRLRTHLVPWVAGGRTHLPLIAGEDIGQAFACAALQTDLHGYEAFNIVGPAVPTVREVIDFLHAEFGYPTPHFSVPFALAYPFAALMEAVDPLVPWEPLVVRSIIHLLEETGADNAAAMACLGYRPQVHWQTAVRRQLAEMQWRQPMPMKMHRPLPDG